MAQLGVRQVVGQSAEGTAIQPEALLMSVCRISGDSKGGQAFGQDVIETLQLETT